MISVRSIVLLLCFSSCAALKCLRCSETFEPRLCNRLETCSKGEACGVQMYRTGNGDITYWTGCMSLQQCTKTPNRTVLHTKRESDFSFGEVICQECCIGDLCNSEGCGKQGYPKSRGPICYDCRDVHDLKDCHKLSPCSYNEKCLMEERTVFGQRYFTSRCEHIQTCQSLDTYPNIFGRKRAVTKACHKCCHGDLCNDDCSDGYTSSPTVFTTSRRSTSFSTVTSTSQTIIRSLISSCNFDVSLCGYTQGRSDNFDWLRENGGTPSSGTGPSQDHTHGSSTGYYMYIESSSPRRHGDRADLITPLYQSTPDACLLFWYSMYGGSIGTLNVYTVSNGIKSRIWTRSDEQGDRWIQATVNIRNLKPSWQIVFEASVGSGYSGDIAIDDVKITNGTCT